VSGPFFAFLAYFKVSVGLPCGTWDGMAGIGRLTLLADERGFFLIRWLFHRNLMEMRIVSPWATYYAFERKWSSPTS